MRAYVPNEQVSIPVPNRKKYFNLECLSPITYPNPRAGYVVYFTSKVIKPRLLGKAGMGKIVVGYPSP
jgi:hypothetical protein